MGTAPSSRDLALSEGRKQIRLQKISLFSGSGGGVLRRRREQDNGTERKNGSSWMGVLGTLRQEVTFGQRLA